LSCDLGEGVEGSNEIKKRRMNFKRELPDLGEKVCVDPEVGLLNPKEYQKLG
jgi:hypothetical protein